MTTPFWCVLVIILIPFILSTLGGVFRVRQLGTLDNKNPRQQAGELEGAGARVYAAQQNAWEAVPVFGLAVVIAHIAGADPAASATTAVVFVVARIVHAFAYLANIDILRSIIFLVGLACVIRLFVLAAQV
jgi:uncharacterized MAPEG superfamily protein